MGSEQKEIDYLIGESRAIPVDIRVIANRADLPMRKAIVEPLVVGVVESLLLHRPFQVPVDLGHEQEVWMLAPHGFGEAGHTEARLVRVGDGYAISSGAYTQARDLLVGELEAAERITLARFRDLLGSSRKTSQLLLERFDADGLTRRVGDERGWTADRGR